MSAPDGTAEILEIEALAAGGRGVARSGGRVWFVEGALPGDRVRPEILRDRGRFVEAGVAELLCPAPGRRTPICPLQDRCGGCPWMPLPEEEQRRWKRRLLIDALERVGGCPARRSRRRPPRARRSATATGSS